MTASTIPEKPTRNPRDQPREHLPSRSSHSCEKPAEVMEGMVGAAKTRAKYARAQMCEGLWWGKGENPLSGPIWEILE